MRSAKDEWFSAARERSAPMRCVDEAQPPRHDMPMSRAPRRAREARAMPPCQADSSRDATRSLRATSALILPLSPQSYAYARGVDEARFAAKRRKM